MGMLIIIGVLILLWAHKSGRPMKLVLTPEESKAVKTRWWKAAMVELKVWAIVFGIGCALAAETLSKEHWHWSIYAFIVWCVHRNDVTPLQVGDPLFGHLELFA